MKKLKAKLIAWLTKDVDLIYTSQGNLPVKDLVFQHEWHFNNEEICFREVYTYNGKMVKQGAHIYKIPLSMKMQANTGHIG